MKARMPPDYLLAALLLALAGRLSAAELVVDDVGDPTPITGTLTLRQAIVVANASAGPDHIRFAIPGSGVRTIMVTSPLPPLTADGTWIDGFSQPGASPGATPPATATILVQLDGRRAGQAHGLVIRSSSNLVRGLSVVNFGCDGIRVEGTQSPGTKDNGVVANFVGIDATGTVGAGNGTDGSGDPSAGISVLCPASPEASLCTGNSIASNLVSGNFRCGIRISSWSGSDCWQNFVIGNFVGTNASGAGAVPNAGSGVVLENGTHENIIEGNVISGNGANGVDVYGNPITTPPACTMYNFVTENMIGVAVDGVSSLGNGARGVSLGIFELESGLCGFAAENAFAMNIIAHNAMCGIGVWEHPLTPANGDRNAFQQNQIHSNGGLGVDLGNDGPTANDPGDADTGPNEQLNAPVILDALHSVQGTTMVTGLVDAGSQASLYRARPDPTGFGEGEVYLGEAWLDGHGGWYLEVAGLSLGDFVTALASDLPVGGSQNTSEFAACVQVRSASDVEGGRGAGGFGLALSGPNPFHGGASFRCRLPVRDEARLAIFDLAGKLVRTLHAGSMESGEHVLRWDGRDAGGRKARAGVYFVSLSAGGQRASRRVVKW